MIHTDCVRIYNTRKAFSRLPSNAFWTPFSVNFFFATAIGGQQHQGRRRNWLQRASSIINCYKLTCTRSDKELAERPVFLSNHHWCCFWMNDDDDPFNSLVQSCFVTGEHGRRWWIAPVVPLLFLSAWKFFSFLAMVRENRVCRGINLSRARCHAAIKLRVEQPFSSLFRLLLLQACNI